MNSPKELKRDLRRAALARRDALDPAWRLEAALEMAEIAKIWSPDEMTIMLRSLERLYTELKGEAVKPTGEKPATEAM